MMLSEDELARITTTRTQAMTDNCALWRAAKLSDGAGGYTETRAMVASCMGRIEAWQTPQAAVMAERLGVKQLVRVILPIEANAMAGDEIETTDTGVHYRVIDFVKKSQETVKICICVLVE